MDTGPDQRTPPLGEKGGAYANLKSIKMKTPEQLKDLKKNGLGILYLGVETGHEELLKKFGKERARNILSIWEKAREAGIKLSVTVLLGIAGRERSLEHARATGELLSGMDPNYVGALTVMLLPGTPLYEESKNGTFEVPTEKKTSPGIEGDDRVYQPEPGSFFLKPCFQYLPIKARLPKGKQIALDQIDSG